MAKERTVIMNKGIKRKERKIKREINGKIEELNALLEKTIFRIRSSECHGTMYRTLPDLNNVLSLDENIKKILIYIAIESQADQISSLGDYYE